MKSSRCIGASVLLLLAVSAMDASAQRRVGTAVTGAGGGSSGAGSIALHATVGQPAIGPVDTYGHALQQGFWYGIEGRITAHAEFGEPVTTGGATFAAEIMPNPSSGAASLLVDIPAAGHLSAVLHDMRGEPVRTLFDGAHGGGRLNIPLDGTDIPSGTYTIVLTSGSTRLIRAFRLVK